MENLIKAIVNREQVAKEYRNEFDIMLSDALREFCDLENLEANRRVLRVLMDSFFLLDEGKQMNDKQIVYDAYYNIDSFIESLQELNKKLGFNLKEAV